MGRMVDGRWQAGEVTASKETADGSFKRASSSFRDWITADGGPGPDGQAASKAEPGRYHLYVSLACPWAHRTLIVRALKGLDEAIGVSVVDPLMRENGWTFATDRGGSGDRLYGSRFLWEIYARAIPDYSGKVTVPVLWDAAEQRIVNNESEDIVRILAHGFDAIAAPGDTSPAELMPEIVAVNERIYDTLNNGVYRAGFATSQAAYDAAVGPLFETLDWLEAKLAKEAWLVGGRMTEADIRLFTTLVRFDPVYHGHFKCNLRRIRDYPALSAFVHRMMDDLRIAATVDFDHIKTHYYASHRDLNPSGVIPAGPVPLLP